MFIAELSDPDFDSFDLSSLRTGIMAGSPCPVEVMKKVIDRMGMREVTICYGMTETSPVSTQTRVSDTLEQRTATTGRVASASGDQACRCADRTDCAPRRPGRAVHSGL